MKIKFLLDEHVAKHLPAALRRRNVDIDIVRVGQGRTPPLGTPDPDLLLFCETEQRALVTNNRKSMPNHERDHFASGQHHWGILEVRPRTTIGKLADELYMFWEASEAEEWIDRRMYIPP